MASQAFTFFQTGNLTPDPPTTITSAISGTTWTNSWVNAISGRAPIGLKVTTYATATPGTAIQTTNLLTGTSTGLYSFTTVTFNTGGTTGRSGPILSAAKSGLTGTPAPSTWYDSYLDMTTTGYQLWTVPATSSYTIRCAGAGTANGLGIIIETTVNLTQGQKIQILVGQQGIRYQTGSSGGCGGSFVASGSTPATGVVLVAAGGGGGSLLSTLSGGVANATPSTTGNTSSDLTGAGGSSGGGGSGSSSGWGGGGGGFTGNGTDSSQLANTRGFSFINGGLGGSDAAGWGAVGGFGGGASTHGNTGGGGGGGGYSGGGGSGQTITGLGGGGGSYPSGATNIGTNSGPGYVIITAATAITVPITYISPITYATPSYSYGTQYGISVQTSNIQGKLSPAITAVATWLAQPTITSVTMTGLTFSIVASASGATGYIYNVIGTPATTPPTVTNTTGSFTCVPLVQYVANVYARATNSQSILSANSVSVWCLTTPVITVGTHTNNIYAGGTRIVGTTFTVVWTAGDANATSYTFNLNGTNGPGTQNTTASTSTTYGVSVNASYYLIVKATATNSTSQTVSTATIYCLTAPTITVGASSTYISGTTFYIVWTAGDANAASYTLYINGVYNSIIASPTVTTTVTVTPGNSYYATLYATALYSTSAASTNSPTIYCLATPVLTTGSGSYSIYNAGTFISGTTFTATWSTIANATGYTVTFYNFNTAVTTTYSPTGLTQTQSVTAANRYNVTVSATALYSTSSQSTASFTIYCLTAPSITSGSTAISGTTFTITWIAGDVNASGYTIFLNGSGTPNTTNSSTLTTPFTVSQGSAYYATVYATASYSTSPVTTTATIPCILHTYTLSMSSTTLTASVSVTPTGYTYSTTALTLYKNNTITNPAVTGSPFTSLVAGNDYSVGASSTATSSSSGNIISPAVPCILLTITLSMSGSTLTPSTAITPTTSSYDATSYSYTLSAYSLIGGSAPTNVANFTGLTAGTSYSVSVSATNYGLTEHFEMTSITTNSGQWTNYSPTWNDWTFYNAGIAIGITGCPWNPPGTVAKTGNYYAYLQIDGAYILHRLTGVVGNTAGITFSYSYRYSMAIPTSYAVYWIPDYGSQVTILTNTVGTLTSWATITTSFQFSGYYTGVIKFINISPGVSDNALLIDNISVTVSPTNSSSGTKTSGSVYCLATPAAPTITFAGTTVTVNWSAVANVNTSGNAYLFYYNGTGVPAVITPSNTGTPFTSATSSLTSLTNGLGKTGSSYYIQMLALGANTVSALSAASSTVYCLATPVISSISISELVLSLSWGAVTNANNYSIYLNGSGSVINVGNTTSTTIAVTLGGNSYYCLIFATNTGTSSAGVSSSTVYTHGVFTAAPTSYFIGSGVSGTSCTLSNNNSTVNYSTSQIGRIGTDFYFIVNTNFGSKPSNNVNWSFTAGRNKNRTLTITGYTGANATGTATTLGTFTNTGTSNSGSISPGTGTTSIYVSIPSFMFVSGSGITYDFTFTLTITN